MAQTVGSMEKGSRREAHGYNCDYEISCSHVHVSETLARGQALTGKRGRDVSEASRK
jgi:hypothetical protein